MAEFLQDFDIQQTEDGTKAVFTDLTNYTDPDHTNNVDFFNSRVIEIVDAYGDPVLTKTFAFTEGNTFDIPLTGDIWLKATMVLDGEDATDFTKTINFGLGQNARNEFKKAISDNRSKEPGNVMDLVDVLFTGARFALEEGNGVNYTRNILAAYKYLTR